MNRGDLQRRGWRWIADARRTLTRAGSAAGALAALGDPDRSSIGGWARDTAEAHDRYRSACPVPDADVAVVCVSMRPELLRDVVANIVRQRHQRVRVVFVAASDDFDHDEIETAFSAIADVVIDHAPSGASLGAALNRGMARTDARFVAKFDDDDLYGPDYLSDALRAHGYAGAGVVGKHSYYARVDALDATYLRFPGNEFRYSGTLAGGTLVIDRDRVDDQRFDDISLGEDRAFLAACHRRGVSTFSTDRFNFTQVRTGANTWSVPLDSFLADAVPVDAGEEIDR